MPGASVAVMPTAAPPTPAAAAATPAARKPAAAPERKYKCQFCNRAFSRSEHRSRHERSHTKERPFKYGGVPLHSDGKRRGNGVTKARAVPGPSKSTIAAIDTAAIEQLEASSEGIFDVETAAMLVADLHHKATAASRASGSPYENGNGIPPFPQNGAPIMEPAVTYPSGAIAIPQWDSFMAQQVESKSHSIASSASGAFDSQSFAVANASQPLATPMPSLSGHNIHAPVAAPVYQSERPRTPVEPPPTPAGFKVPQVNSDDERNIILDNIRNNDTEHAIPEGFRVPNISSINRYLSTYFGLFHHHLPFLNPVSFSPTQVSPPLLLSVLSIGALYAFDLEQAYILHIGSKVMVNQFLQHKENFSSRKCPLWTMQCSLLNMIFASWSGDPKGLEWACSIKSLLANMVAGNRYELKLRQEGREGRSPTRSEWVEDEGCRRTYYAVYIFFGLLTMSFNYTPAIGFNEFEDLQLPSTEAMWNLKVADEASWQEHLKASQAVTFIEAHDNLFQGETIKYSAFATRVMINALFLEVWYHKRSPEALQDVVTEYKLRLALETWEKSLDLCEPEASSVPLSAPHKGHPLTFNARAMCRSARARLEVDLKTVQEALRYHDSYEVAAAMSNARDKVKRSGEMIKVIQECYECIETAVAQGVRWVARTSPTNWSIEHPLCGMDLMIILSLWLYRLEHDEEAATEEELKMYEKVRQLFEQDVEEAFSTQLSSIVARLWGSMLDEVVVWGITRLMGESFRLHSQALVGYVDDIEASSGATTPSMTSQGADEDSVLY
ncbi:hypothetical protein SCUCBS95973_004317 [Sporothrix curviconia]|uniref:C2H2-type domain-containing protein n=1 Tax=Sporothrix curviconia TaxID=1260050 RepID=A0ABP0BPD3_9PEZI